MFIFEEASLPFLSVPPSSFRNSSYVTLPLMYSFAMKLRFPSECSNELSTITIDGIPYS